MHRENNTVCRPCISWCIFRRKLFWVWRWSWWKQGLSASMCLKCVSKMQRQQKKQEGVVVISAGRKGGPWWGLNTQEREGERVVFRGWGWTQPSPSFPDEPWEKNQLSVRLLKSPGDHGYKRSPMSSEWGCYSPASNTPPPPPPPHTHTHRDMHTETNLQTHKLRAGNTHSTQASNKKTFHSGLLLHLLKVIWN